MLNTPIKLEMVKVIKSKKKSTFSTGKEQSLPSNLSFCSLLTIDIGTTQHYQSALFPPFFLFFCCTVVFKIRCLDNLFVLCSQSLLIKRDVPYKQFLYFYISNSKSHIIRNSFVLLHLSIIFLTRFLVGIERKSPLDVLIWYIIWHFAAAIPNFF